MRNALYNCSGARTWATTLTTATWHYSRDAIRFFFLWRLLCLRLVRLRFWSLDIIRVRKAFRSTGRWFRLATHDLSGRGTRFSDVSPTLSKPKRFGFSDALEYLFTERKHYYTGTATEEGSRKNAANNKHQLNNYVFYQRTNSINKIRTGRGCERNGALEKNC